MIVIGSGADFNEYEKEFVRFFGFLPSSSTTRLYHGRAPRLTSDNFKGSKTRVRSGRPCLLSLTPTLPVASGQPQRGSNQRPPHQESHALPTELPRATIRERQRQTVRKVGKKGEGERQIQVDRQLSRQASRQRKRGTIMEKN